MLIPIKKALEVEDPHSELLVGVVEDREDPEKAGRLKIRIPALHGNDVATEELPWAVPFRSILFGSKQGVGFFSIPYVGSKVVVAFHRGDAYSPIYLAQTVSPSEIPQELLDNYGQRYGFSDAIGNKFFVDEEQGIAVFTHKSGTQLQISDNGSVTVSVVTDETKTVDGNSSITVKGDATFVVDGDSSFICKGAALVEVEQDAQLQIGGNVDCTIDGSLTAVCASADVTSQGAAKLTCASAEVVAQGLVEVTSSDAKINCQSKAEVIAPQVDVQSTTIRMTASGLVELIANSVTIKSATIELGEGATEPFILGNQFALWLQSTLLPWALLHTHTVTAPGAQTAPSTLPLTLGTALPNGVLYSKSIRGK